MQIRISKADIIWNYVGTVLSSVAGFLLLPFLIYYLSASELGLWYVYLAVGNLVTLFQFGFSPTFARNFAYCWSGARSLTQEGCTCAEGDVDPALMAHLIAACKTVYRRVSLVALVVLAVPGTIYILSVTNELNLIEVLLSWVIFSLGVLLNLYFLWYESALSGIGAVAASNQVAVAARLSQIIVAAALLIFGMGLVGSAVGFFLNALVYRFAGSRKFWCNPDIVKLELKTIPINKSEVMRLYKIVSYNAFRDGGVMLSNYASTQASSLICSTFLGLAQSGAFSIALQFATAIGNMGRAYMNSCTPMLQSACQRGDQPLVRHTLGLCSAVYVLISILGFIGVIGFIYPVLNIFKPGSNLDPFVFCGVMVYMFLFNWCALFASMLANMNTIPYLKAYVVTAAFSIVLSAAFASLPGFGAWGLILGLCIPQCAYNVWHWPAVTASRMGSTPFALLCDGVLECRVKAKAFMKRIKNV